MAGKPPKKSTKNTSVKKATSQTASTVTPISEGVKHGEIQNRVAQVNASSVGNQANSQAGNQATGQKAPEQKITDHKIAEQKIDGQKPDGHKAVEHKTTHYEIAEQIRVRAYELFEQRGRHEGHDHEDWTRAEAEILSKYQREKSA